MSDVKKCKCVYTRYVKDGKCSECGGSVEH